MKKSITIQEETRLCRYHNIVRIGLDVLYDAAADGNDLAFDTLQNLAKRSPKELVAQRVSAQRKRKGKDHPSVEDQAAILFNTAARRLNILYDAAAGGDTRAREALRDLADALLTRAGDLASEKKQTQTVDDDIPF